MEAPLAPLTKAVVGPAAPQDLATVEVKEGAPTCVVGPARQVGERVPRAHPVAAADLHRAAAAPAEAGLDGP